jgi:hypothetical protein
VFRLARDPEWAHIGPRWYLQHHSIWAFVWRALKGAGQVIGVWTYTAGPGITAGTPANLQPTIAASVARVIGGAAVAVLVACGLVLRHRAGHRAEVLAVTHVCGWMLLAFAVGAQGVGGVATRFMLPFVVIGIPFAAHALVEMTAGRRAPLWLARPWAPLLLLAPFAIKLAWFAPAFAHNPRHAFAVPPAWAETSAWFAAHLQPGERYATTSGSLYSTWDDPFPDPDARWIYLFDRPADKMLADMQQGKPMSNEPHRDGPIPSVTKILVDSAAPDIDGYRVKLSGPSDAHGPLAFLGWRRCFADAGTPSRFAIYCRD